jgi:hypothetical protein
MFGSQQETCTLKDGLHLEVDAASSVIKFALRLSWEQGHYHVSCTASDLQG